MDTLKLLRIPFSYFLMPVFFFALSQAMPFDTFKAFTSFIVLHLFIYPASNGYNSYMDKDETSIGGLESPPKPTKNLFYASLLFDTIGLLLSLAIGIKFFCMILIYTIASRAYSFKGIRLKKYAIIGFLTVVIFQGSFTFWMIYSSISVSSIALQSEMIYILFGCFFLIGGVYPITQIYQHEADKANADLTLSYKLGIKGTFLFSASMFMLATVFLYLYFSSIQKLSQFYLMQFFLFPVIYHFIGWFIKVLKIPDEANYRNTMKMNFIAATCMNLFFITILILNLYK